jgi:hypothetical protein
MHGRGKSQALKCKPHPKCCDDNNSESFAVPSDFTSLSRSTFHSSCPLKLAFLSISSIHQAINNKVRPPTPTLLATGSASGPAARDYYHAYAQWVESPSRSLKLGRETVLSILRAAFQQCPLDHESCTPVCLFVCIATNGRIPYFRKIGLTIPNQK